MQWTLYQSRNWEIFPCWHMIGARLDFIARRDFIYSVYSDRPDEIPSPSTDARDHFGRPLSCFYDQKISQSISPRSSSSHLFFHDSLVSNNMRTFNDCTHDSSISRPHPVHSVRAEQTGNAIEHVSTRSSFLSRCGSVGRRWNNAFATGVT